VSIGGYRRARAGARSTPAGEHKAAPANVVAIDGRSGDRTPPARTLLRHPSPPRHGPPRPSAPTGGIDRPRLVAAARELLLSLGEDPERDGLLHTPERIADTYCELFSGLHEDPARHLDVRFEADHEELVLVRDIRFASLCEHHLLPFTGVAHVGYVPGTDGRITGLSKLARLVDGYARRPQVQERLTSQVADAIEARLSPRGVVVVIEAEHLCMSIRGVRKPGTVTVTSAVRGVLRDNPAARGEAMSMLHGRNRPA
jgi:GTP cyclohydrolase I